MDWPRLNRSGDGISKVNTVRKMDYTYTADDEYQPPQGGVIDAEKREYFPYLPDNDLKEAVNLAIELERPLLLEGEPGCGKTRLASAVAYEYSIKNLKAELIPSGDTDDADNSRLSACWNFYIWNVKSTERASDGLYKFDAIARLRDAQLVGSDPEKLEQYLGKDEQGKPELEKLIERLRDVKNYRKFGKLGAAMIAQSYRPIVLIDEIDKADSDFCNDLLLELDQFRFEIQETDEEFSLSRSNPKPIIIITSNREKPLPDPFLRRCLYYYVEFPDSKTLNNIVERRFGTLKKSQQELVKLAIERFYKIRERLEKQPGSHPPGTSEFIEFLTVLLNKKSVTEAKRDVSNLAERPALLGTLLKTKSAQTLIQAMLKQDNPNG